MDTISVIVPVYNLENYIEKTVESILAETYPKLEVILVDDGSKDKSPEILDRLARKDERVRVIHKKNGGVTSARLCGIKAASGEWIGFVDGDDFIEPEMYAVLMENAQKYGADISHCGYQMVYPSRIDRYYGTGRLLEQDHFSGVRDILSGAFVEPCLCDKLFRRSLFKDILENDRMDLSIKNTEDLLMSFYLFRGAQKSVFLDECFYHYILRKGSAATSKLNEHKLKDPLKVLKLLRDEVQSEPELLRIVEGRITANLIGQATMSKGTQEDLVAPVRKEAQKELRGRLSRILKSGAGKKQKLFALWVSVWPASYSFVHRVYAKTTGLDKKYEVR